MNIVLICIIPILAFILESYPRFINRRFGVDVWTHLLYLQEFHRQKRLPRNISNGFIITGDYDYPPIFIYILSLFPFKLVEKYEFLFSPVVDSIFMMLFGVITYVFTGSIVTTLLTQGMYILTPIIAIENSSATPRSLGYALFAFIAVFEFLYMGSGNTLYLYLSIFLGVWIFLAHRFSTQGYLFFSIVFTLIERRIEYAFVFVISLLLTIFISRGYYLKVLSGHLGNLRFWKANIQYRFAHQVKGLVAEKNPSDFVLYLYRFFLKFPPFVLAVTSPWMILAISLSLIPPVLEGFYLRMFWLVGFSYALSLFTLWIPQLRFLGEGQRYLELTAFPTALLSAVAFERLLEGSLSVIVIPAGLVVAILCLVTILVIQKKGIIDEKMRTVTPEIEHMFAYLKDLKKKPRLLCIPHQMTTSTIYHTGCEVLVNADYTNIIMISDIYPVLRKPILEIMHEFELDEILLNQNYAAIEDLHLKKYIVIKESGPFVLLKLK